MADPVDARGGLELAYIGDAVFELMVRRHFFNEGTSRANALHLKVVALVCAKAQARMAEKIEPTLEPKERSIYNRGRNAHPKTVAKSSNPAEYMKATALEALFGWLYLSGRNERLNELFERALEIGLNL
jgi:ribonuclease-3 family protein